MTEEPVVRPDRLPKVALLVAAYNAAPILPRCLNGILAQNPDQVVVVNDGSSDDTRGLLERFEQVDSIHLDQNAGVGNARNRALEAVRSDIQMVAFIDSDIVLEDGWLQTLLCGVDWDAYSIACGRVSAADVGKHWAATLDEAKVRKRWSTQECEIEYPWREVMYFNYLFKKEVFKEVGGFDPRFRTNAEDSDYFYRCWEKGHRFYFQPEAKARHCYPPPTLKAWLKRCYRNGFFTIQFHMKNRTPLVSQKKAKGGILLILITVQLFLPTYTSSAAPWFVALLVFFLWGLVETFRIDQGPLLGGWIAVLGWFAKGLGEIVGILKHKKGDRR